METRAPAGVNIAIVSENKVLLTLREDFEVWCLPGGAIEDSESAAQAAIREALEETGLQVEITHLVGVYSELHPPRRGQHMIVFAARPTSGLLKPDRREVLEARYFHLSELPDALLFGHRRRIQDLFEGAGGSRAWSQSYPWPFEPDITRSELYERRDRSGLTRQQFYLQHYRPSQAEEKFEAGTRKGSSPP